MRIFIDGDACPVTDITYKIAGKYGIEVIPVMSINVYSQKNRSNTIYVDSGYQSADMEILNRVKNGDIVVTGDYGLASLCIMKYCACISFSGMIIDNKNIDELLNARFISQKVRNAGGRVKGPSKRTHEDDGRFGRNLEKIILSSNFLNSK